MISSRSPYTCMKMLNVFLSLFPENIFEESWPGFKVMPIRSQYLQVLPSKNVVLGDHPVRPFAEEEVGRAGSSNMQGGGGGACRNRHPNLFLDSFKLKYDTRHCWRNFYPMWPEQERDLGVHAVGNLPQNEVFVDQCGHQKAFSCLHLSINVSTMVCCLYCQMFQAMDMQHCWNTASSTS